MRTLRPYDDAATGGGEPHECDNLACMGVMTEPLKQVALIIGIGFVTMMALWAVNILSRSLSPAHGSS